MNRAPASLALMPSIRAEATTTSTLRRLFWTYRWRILLTYGLFNLENLLRLAQPFVLGLTINELLRGSYTGLLVFAGQHLGYTLIGSLRRAYDTRTFTGIYADLASALVIEQRERQVEVSRVAARSALSRVFVDFFERDLSAVFAAGYAVLGALVMLAVYDPLLLPCCLMLVAPVILLNSFYSRKTLELNERLHDELEREVEVIGAHQAEEVRGHYGMVARWQIKLSDWEALNFSLTELFVLGLMAITLIRACNRPEAQAGDIFAVFRYVLMFVMALDSVPVLVHQLSRLRDVGRRMRQEQSDTAEPAPHTDSTK